jgi:hypothetical protein
MKSLQRLLTVLAFTSLTAVANPPAIHVWEMQEITFQAKNSYKNAYTDATVWVDLSGPGFNKKVYGFWDGGNTFRVRVVATKPGAWTWKSGSTPNDAGLSGKTGSFTAVDWTEEKKRKSLTPWFSQTLD